MSPRVKDETDLVFLAGLQGHPHVDLVDRIKRLYLRLETFPQPDVQRPVFRRDAQACLPETVWHQEPEP
jgi:hypothetical protein